MKLEMMDFGAVEARTMAALKDRGLSAKDVFAKPYGGLTEEQRLALKAINIGIMYGVPDWLIDGIKTGRFKVVAAVPDELVFEEQAPN